MTRNPAKGNYLFFHYLDYFSSKLEAAILDNVIKMPPHFGTGFIKWHILEEGFGLRFFDFIANQDIEFNLFTKEESGAVYKLVFELDKEHSQLSGVLTNKDAHLYFSDLQKKIKIRRGEHICRVVLIFNTEWLEKNHPNANAKVKQLLTTRLHKNQSTSIPKELDRKNYYLLKQLVERMNHSPFPPLFLKINSCVLLSNFLDKLIEHAGSEAVPNNSSRFKEISEVAEELKKYINNPFFPLPKVGNLAHEFNMSESTLRRHFKATYGKNIYQYYQEKRMLWAKSQLEKGDITINEIAHKLGFVKSNNFSKAFRKEFHMLPNKLKYLLIMIMYMSFITY